MRTYCCLMMFFVVLGTANAQQHPISIAAEANGNWCEGVVNCATFPFGKQVFNGVTFHIPGTAATRNAWFAYKAANAGRGSVSVTVPVSIGNVKTVYTLMNTNWGSTDSGLLTITFTASNGTTWTYDLRGNVNIRDHNQDGFTNDIDYHLPNGAGQATAINAWTSGDGQRLDMQIYELPTSFKGQTLLSITVTDNGDTNLQRSLLAAVTVSTTHP